MRLLVDPKCELEVFNNDLTIVISAREGASPEMHFSAGSAKPDRHLLLGMAQAVMFAVEESDPDMVRFVEFAKVTLDDGNVSKELTSNLLIARDDSGKYGALVIGAGQGGKRLAREVTRWFTGTIRLDIP
jgi:hypothetical protein